MYVVLPPTLALLILLLSAGRRSVRTDFDILDLGLRWGGLPWTGLSISPSFLGFFPLWRVHLGFCFPLLSMSALSTLLCSFCLLCSLASIFMGYPTFPRSLLFFHLFVPPPLPSLSSYAA